MPSSWILLVEKYENFIRQSNDTRWTTHGEDDSSVGIDVAQPTPFCHAAPNNKLINMAIGAATALLDFSFLFVFDGNNNNCTRFMGKRASLSLVVVDN